MPRMKGRGAFEAFEAKCRCGFSVHADFLIDTDENLLERYRSCLGGA